MSLQAFRITRRGQVDPDTQADAFNGTPADYSGSLSGSGDDALGLTFSFSNVSQGDVLTFCHAYVFGTDFDDAVSGSACTGTLTYDPQRWELVSLVIRPVTPRLM
jgi:hypothetical protein